MDPTPPYAPPPAGRGWDVRTLALGVAACAAALGVHGRSLAQPYLYADDFLILAQSKTWADTRANLWVPVNEHSWPLTRVATYAVVQTAGRPTALPLATAVAARVALVLGMGLTYLFVRRERGDPFPGLVGMAVYGVTAVYQEAVFWYAASPALAAVDTTLLALLAAQRWRQTGRRRHLALSAVWSAMAPGWYAGGVLAGPLAALYLLGPRPLAGRWTAFVPVLGSLAFLAVSLPRAGDQILHAQHYGPKTAVQAFDLPTGLANTGRAVVDNLVLGAVGVAGVSCPVPVVVAGLVALVVVGRWWWRQAPDRRLVLLGAGCVLGGYLLIFAARAEWPYDRLRGWSRYNVFPQFGVALVVAGGLTRGRAWVVGAVIAGLFLVNLPRGLALSPAAEPEQMAVLRRVEEVDERCRANRISAADARAVLGDLGLPGGDGFSAWNFLRGSDDPRPVTEAEARRVLLP